jgi:hypothetical protein
VIRLTSFAQQLDQRRAYEQGMRAAAEAVKIPTSGQKPVTNHDLDSLIRGQELLTKLAPAGQESSYAHRSNTGAFARFAGGQGLGYLAAAAAAAAVNPTIAGFIGTGLLAQDVWRGVSALNREVMGHKNPASAVSKNTPPAPKGTGKTDLAGGTYTSFAAESDVIRGQAKRAKPETVFFAKYNSAEVQPAQNTGILPAVHQKNAAKALKDMHQKAAQIGDMAVRPTMNARDPIVVSDGVWHNASLDQRRKMATGGATLSETGLDKDKLMRAVDQHAPKPAQQAALMGAAPSPMFH